VRFVVRTRIFTLVLAFSEGAQVRGGKRKRLLKWNLSDLLKAAGGMGWLPTGLERGTKWNTRRAKIGDYVEALRQTRNFVHPGRYVCDRSPSIVTKPYLERFLNILDVSADCLFAEVNAYILAQLENVDADDSKGDQDLD